MTLTKTVSVEQLQERTVGMKFKKKKKDFFRGFDIKREKKNFLEVLLLRERKK